VTGRQLFVQAGSGRVTAAAFLLTPLPTRAPPMPLRAHLSSSLTNATPLSDLQHTSTYRLSTTATLRRKDGQTIFWTAAGKRLYAYASLF